MVPFVLALRLLKVHRAISVMVLSWSAVTIGTAFVRNYEGLLATRLILGICESGFFPCLSLYITMVYNRREQGLRFAYLYSAIALSGMFGGLVATGITKIRHYAGLNTWSWLYIVEGCISLIVVPWAWYGLPENPTKAKFWTPEERATMELRDIKRQEYMGANHFSWPQVTDALKSWRLYTGYVVAESNCVHRLTDGYCSALIQFFQDIILYGFSSFLPSILRDGLGYTPLQAQYLSVPVYFLGGVAFFTAALIGDKWGLRGTALLVLDVFAVIGYAILLTVKSSSVQYFAVYLIALALYCGPGLNEIWITTNTAPHYKRATFLGVSLTFGNLAGVVAGQVYRDPPYRLGHWASLVSVIICMVLIAVQIVFFKFENRKKEQIKRGERPDDRQCTTGEYNLDFKYAY